MADNQHDRVNALFTELYEKYNMRLRFYVRSLGVSENLDDVLSTTFERVYARMLKLSPEEIHRIDMLRYLKRTARNEVINQHRKKKRENRSDLSSREDLDDDSVLDTIADDALQPEEIYEEKERRERLVKATAKLPEKLRTAVQEFLGGKTKEEIGNEIGIGAPAVGWRLRKACQILRDMPEIQQIRDDY